MKLYSWNVNGIRAVWNKGLFQDFIAKHDPDIICLQETKAQPDQSPIDLPQYTEYWYSADKKGYSGTAIFSKTPATEVRNGFSDTIQKKYNFADSFGDTSKEGRVLSAKINGIWIVTVYTPNSKDKLERLPMRYQVWDKSFLDHLQELEQDAPVLTCGDFNVAHKEIDLARPKESAGKHGFTIEEREGFDNFMQAGYTDTFRHLHPTKAEAYTWWTAWGGARQRNVGWRIDYWLVSKSFVPKITQAAIHADVMGSDHCPVSITIKD
ncbi:exodeoxyribonuclease III [bacterium]|nr:exodeoxyribonuclease III [bacterium]NBX97938.1 exodeoxyribonuclease III [bacterium]NDC94634.1 exodeoxyribonuclease III [bacterium]NDD83775.1 exodeoxyribonuclease III [bacterium]NDG28818.1 exodeoxyribonuclease III [bacterium]